MRRYVCIACGLAVLALAATAALAQRRHAPTWDGVPRPMTDYSVFEDGKLVERHGNGPLKLTPKSPRKPTDPCRDLTVDQRSDQPVYTSPQPGFLTVSGKADFMTDPNDAPVQWYYWTLKVRTMPFVEGHSEIVWEHDYKDQIFPAPLGKRIEPAFRQTVPLAPGRYLVSLGLVELLQNDDGTFRSSMADGSLSGPLRSFWAVVE